MAKDLEYFVYDISKEVEPVEIDDTQVQNIEKIISEIIDKTENQSIKYYVEDETDKKHPIVKISKIWKKNTGKINTKKLKRISLELANSLLEVEQSKETGERKKNIKEGMLFIKATKNQISIIKLESTDIMDKKSFELKEALNINKHYYKIALIKKNKLKGINVVDKNKNVSKYWAEEFLNIKKERSSKNNTEYLIKSLAQDKLFTEDIKSSSNYTLIKRSTMHYLKNNTDFSQENLFNSLDILDDDLSAEEILNNDIFKEIDDEFKIDKETILSNSKGKLTISKNIDIISKDLEDSLRDKKILFIDSNKLLVTIDDEYIQKIKENFKDDEQIKNVKEHFEDDRKK